MRYIVLDLEWNQPLSYDSRIFREVGDKLIFDMIQIGAVKLDDDLHICDTVSIPIRPQKYQKIHPRIRRMTHLDNEMLASAETLNEAVARFAAWCAGEQQEEYALLTWGCDDVSVLKQNMDFYKCDVSLPPMCDIQRLFSDVYGCRERKGLKAAMDMLGIEPDESLYFHNAMHDSYYTAQVFAKLPDPSAVLKYPQAPRSLTHAAHMHRRGTNCPGYPTVEAALAGKEATHPECPVCGRPAKVEEGGYVRQAPDKFITVARCHKHGNLLVRLNLRPQDEGCCSMKVTVSRADGNSIAYVHTKRLQIARRSAMQAKQNCKPDMDGELLNADRSSMPYED